MKFSLRSLKDKTIFWKWLFSYITILFIPVIISSVVLFQAEHIVELEVKRANSALLRQMQQTIDSRIRDLNTISYQISMSPNINNRLTVTEPLNSNNILSGYDIEKELNIYHINNNFIYEIYVYFSASDCVVFSSGACTTQLLYRQIHKYKDIIYEDWLNNILNTQHFIDWVPITIYDNADNPKKMLMLMHTIPSDITTQPKAQSIIMIDETTIKNIISNNDWANKGNVLIADSKNRILVSTAKENSLPIIDQSFPLVSGSFLKTVNNEKMYVSYLSSEINDWKYISIMPSNIFMEKIEYIRNITIVCILFCIIFGSILSYILVHNNYTPLREVINSFPNKLKSKLSKSNNEFNFIKNSISSILDEKKQLSDVINEQKPIMKTILLARILKGKFIENSNLTEKMEFLNIKFMSDRFSVISINIDDHSSFFATCEDERWVIIPFILSNIFEELLCQKHIGYFFELDNYMGCLINFNLDTNAEEVYKDINDLVVSAQKLIQSEFKLYFTVGVSNTINGISNIPEAYTQSLAALEFVLITGKNKKISYYSDISNLSYKYDYSLQTERQLVNYVKVGDYEHVKDLLNKVFERVSFDSSLSISMARCIFFDMMSTVFKIYEEINAFDIKLNLNETEYADNLIKCKTIKAMKFQINSLYKNICDHINSSKKDHFEKLEMSIIKFIGENYKDNCLSVTTISEKFNMNGTYLSRIFKKQTGYSLIDYLNKVRIDSAKQLIADKNSNIGDIAIKVGFTSVNTLIRTFKRLEGITPGQYREIV